MDHHPILEEAYQALDQHYWSEPEYLAYEQESKRIRDYKATLDEAEDRGIQKGLQQGLQQGRQEERLEMARNLLGEGADIEFVKRITKLSDEAISQLCLH